MSHAVDIPLIQPHRTILLRTHFCADTPYISLSAAFGIILGSRSCLSVNRSGATHEFYPEGCISADQGG